MTYTSTTTTTRTHTATYLTDVIMGAVADILADLGIDLTTLYRDWTQDENAISAWILEGSLKEVVLECHQPRGTVAPVIEFPITYKASGTGDAVFTASRARLARFRAKLDRVPVGTTYRLFCTFNGPHTSQPGWSPGIRASIQGLRSINYGTLGSAPDASATMRYLHPHVRRPAAVRREPPRRQWCRPCPVSLRAGGHVCIPLNAVCWVIMRPWRC